jgi:hypothetical protein
MILNLGILLNPKLKRKKGKGKMMRRMKMKMKKPKRIQKLKKLNL